MGFSFNPTNVLQSLARYSSTAKDIAQNYNDTRALLNLKHKGPGSFQSVPLAPNTGPVQAVAPMIVRAPPFS